MASTSEIGHDKNVAHLEDLIAFCIGYGATYNPSKVNLKIPALQTLLTNGRTVIQTVKTTKTPHDNATNAREIGFNPLKKLCTRIINSLASTDATKQTINDAKTINRKIQGSRPGTTKTKTPLITENTETNATAEINQISNYQQSFNSAVDFFAKLIVTISAEPLYTPNENDLKVTALNATLANLKTLNTAVINVTPAFSNAMISRDVTLYQTGTGLVDIALSVKKYVKSVYGATSLQYQQISGIEFKRIKK